MISTLSSVDRSSQMTNSSGSLVCAVMLSNCSGKKRAPLYVHIATEIRCPFIRPCLLYFWATAAISSPASRSILSHAHSILCITLPHILALCRCIDPISYLPVRRTSRLATYAVLASRMVVAIFLVRKPASCNSVSSELTVKIRRCRGGSR